MKINARLLVRLYPRACRDRYGEEILTVLDERMRPRDVADVFCGVANEWMAHMTDRGYWNDQAQRTTRALAQASAAVIAFQTFVPPIVTAVFGEHVYGASTFGKSMLWGFISSLLQSAVTLGPVALVSAVVPWRDVPYARAAAAFLAVIIGFRIGSQVAWGPSELVIVLAAAWVGYRTVSIEPSMALHGASFFE